LSSVLEGQLLTHRVGWELLWRDKDRITPEAWSKIDIRIERWTIERLISLANWRWICR
jgi:hypothetical protein